MVTQTSNAFRFIQIIKSDTPLTWNDYHFAADVDYVSFFMQYHIGIISVGTVAWMMEQTVEKYCKAILMKTSPIKYTEELLSNPRKYGHNLLKLWEEIKTIDSQISFEPTYNDLVNEINAITTQTRYLNHSTSTNLGLIGAFTILGCELRYELLGREEFNKLYFGLMPDLLSPMMFLNSYNFEILFKKLMHLSIEHGICFSESGIPDSYESIKLNLSFASGKFCQCGKHPEIEKDCPVCNNKIWKNGLRSPKDAKILNDYFGQSNAKYQKRWW